MRILISAFRRIFQSIVTGARSFRWEEIGAVVRWFLFLLVLFCVYFKWWYSTKQNAWHPFCCCNGSTFYDRGRSFFSRNKAHKETLATLTTLKRTPGISPTAWPFRPKPATRTSSFSYEDKPRGEMNGTAFADDLLRCSWDNHPEERKRWSFSRSWSIEHARIYE